MLGEHLDGRPTRSTTGARMNTPGNGPPGRPSTVERRLERVALACRRRCGGPCTSITPSGGWSGRPSSTSRASTISPAHVPKTGSPSRSALARAASRSPDVSSSLLIVVDSPPGSTSASSRAQVGTGCGPRRSSTPSASSTSRCSRNAPWSARTPAFMPWGHRVESPLRRSPSGSPAAVGELDVERARSPRRASPRRDRATPWRRSRRRRSAWSPRRSALAITAGFSLLKIPLPTNTACAPSCITSDASAGVAMPPAQNSGTGSSPRSATSWTSSTGARSSLAHAVELGVVGDGELADVAEDRPEVAARPRRCCRCRPRPWSGSCTRPRRCAAAPRRGWSRRTRTAR